MRRVDNNKRIINLFQSLFGDSNTKNVVLEKSYKEYLEGFTDIATGEARRVQLKLKKTKKSSYLKALQEIDMEDKTAVEEFKVEYFISDEDIENMKGIELLKERTIQDYRSTYNDIREWLRRERSGKETELETINDKASIIESFYKFAQAKLKKEALDLIEEEKLNEEEAKRYIANSLKSCYHKVAPLVLFC